MIPGLMLNNNDASAGMPLLGCLGSRGIIKGEQPGSGMKRFTVQS